MKKLLCLLLIMLFLKLHSRADEGMWLPFLIQELNIHDMQKSGCRLTAEDIYSINNSSLKDAIVSLGGCTGEMISSGGLLLTNHHCAFRDIQKHSTVDHNYLEEGFWAASKEEELPNQSKTARFLIRAEDVTGKVLAGVTADMTFTERQKAVSEAIAGIEKEAVGDTHYQAQVSSFFESNNYYLFVYETFRDVRLVGFPPQSLGKFGGDTDNWMWPRHTADFAIYRVYCGKDGKPAFYSKDNVPLKPRHYLPISLKGADNNDFVMVMGYPGQTNRYITSDEVRFTMDVTNRVRIAVRGEKLAIIKDFMKTSQKARLQYADKHASSSNYFKYSIGQNGGLNNLRVIDKKQTEENKFLNWMAQSPERGIKYGKALEMIRNSYGEQENEIALEYLSEALLRGPEIFMFAYRSRALYNLLERPGDNKERIAQIASNMRLNLDDYFRDYDVVTDQRLTGALMKLYADSVKQGFHPAFFRTIQTKFKGNFDAYASYIFEKTIFGDQGRLTAFLNNPSRKVLEKDPAFNAAGDIFDILRNLAQETEKNSLQAEEGRHLYLAALKEMSSESKLYPDANSTMRLTYGTVRDYQPRDGVYYSEYTTVRGYLEKERPGDFEFDVPARMKELILARDFGRYADRNGELRTCFISNTDITGGNSGSPVINANGELVGIAFDGNWEAMSGDIVFEPDIQRTISVDIRFVLWVVDKYAGATYLTNEMTILE